MPPPNPAPRDWRADDYQRFRPDYPNQLFDWLAQQVPAHCRALDVGCGTGQATRPLTTRFHTVIACDLLPRQLAALQAPANCYPITANSAALPFVAHSMDLITVAQALHWFSLPQFYREADRVLSVDGLLAVWTYGLCEIEGDCGALIRDFHDHTLSAWWAPNRKHVVDGYRHLTLPWPLLPTPELWLRQTWHAEQMLGYLGTWSAVAAASNAGHDMLAGFAPLLHAAWGNEAREVRWPLHLKVARKDHLS